MIAKLFDQLGEHFIGLWAYRERGKRRTYCVTVLVNGYYFDGGHRTTIERALSEALRVVKSELREASQ